MSHNSDASNAWNKTRLKSKETVHTLSQPGADPEAVRVMNIFLNRAHQDLGIKTPLPLIPTH